MKNKFLIIDFDSTLIKTEGLEALAEIVLAESKNREAIVGKIEDITNRGMEGSISFRESLESRLGLLAIEKRHIELLGEKLKREISESVKNNIDYFRDNKDSIYIISGGFKDFILFVTRELGLHDEQVIANTFVYNDKDEVIGFDQSNPLSGAQGKVNALKSIKIDGEIVVVGDGWTDYEMREAGIADKFIAYCENVRRDKVCEVADRVVNSFDEIV